MKKIIIALSIIFFSVKIYADDTIRYMHYNVLYYGVETSYCTLSQNSLDDKEPAFRDIVDYAKPDILTLNEVSFSVSQHQRILDSVMNSNGRDYYRFVPSTNLSGGSIVNMIYYNSNKLSLESSIALQTNVRDFNICKFYYNSDDLAFGDTAFLYSITSHLKAGSGTTDQASRADMVTILMQYLDNISTADNYIFGADLNVYKSSETAYQTLLNHSNTAIRFNDPINAAGNWNNNASYKNYHTQSTHIYSDGGCFSPGGMDDRFDQILVNSDILNNTKHFYYIPNSYTAIGQDGNRFNGNVLTSNTSAPANVIQALYDLSDHLPVYLDLKVDKNLDPTISIEEQQEISYFNVQNPVNDFLKISYRDVFKIDAKIEIYSLDGRKVYDDQCHFELNNQASINVSDLDNGIYILRISDSEKIDYSTKLLIENK